MDAILFDLDGVLCETKELHYVAFNKALSTCGYEPIDHERHTKEFDGLSTRQKLNKLGLEGGDVSLWKQYFTNEMIDTQIQPNPQLRKVLTSFQREHIKLGCASNCIRKTQLKILTALGIVDLFDAMTCNEDVDHPKPAPDVFLRCAERLGVPMNACIIVEDSPIGVMAAHKANPSKVIVVQGPKDVNVQRILGIIPPTVIIPMAGEGRRFKDYGKKPFISVCGEHMIQQVHRNLGVEEVNTIFMVRDEDQDFMTKKFPLATIVSVGSHTTEGTAITVQKALPYLSSDVPVMVANSDQIVDDFDVDAFCIRMYKNNADGGIVTFDAPDKNPKWSYVKMTKDGCVKRVAEKEPISTTATVGIYWWKTKAVLESAIDKLVRAKDKVNGEYYLCPTFNHMAGLKVITYPCTEMHGVGTPEDLESYHQYKTPKFISHRANINGPNPKLENNPIEILRVHREYGCDVEIDVWKEGPLVWLGHDKPQYRVEDESFFKTKPWLWCHAKNHEALEYLLEQGVHCFFHQKDDQTITSRGYVWTYPGQPLVRGGVAVKPESVEYSYAALRKVAYVCSDFADPTRWGCDHKS
jgi:HAD superfamily hydrolase (TIGR01509 family)